MNRITPTWLSMRNTPNEDAGNRNADAPGKNVPTTDGPRTIPAIISPMTAGCPNLTKIAPKILASRMIRINWTSSKLSGSRRFSRTF